MFLDQNNQAHVDGDYDPDVAELLGTEAISVDLDLNVRNTQAIVHVVQEYLGADVGDPGIVHGEKVYLAPTHRGRPDQLKLRSIAAELRSDGASNDSIWIIDVCGDASPASEPAGIRRSDTPSTPKGLEAEHVVVCNLPDARSTARAPRASTSR